MKRTLYITFLVLFASLSAYCQKADEMFRSVVDGIKAFKNIEISFEYKMTNDVVGINETITGNGFLQGDAYRLDLGSQILICDSNTLWTYLPDDAEVMISDVNAEDGSNSPLSIIESYYDNVNVVLDDKNEDFKSFVITPQNEDKFKKIVVNIDKKTSHLKEIHVYDDDDNIFSYIINKFVTNQELPQNTFVFDEESHPDVEVIDMR
ncbi:MAG TPA: outer membrane lipoprotein carrier protein LolA [Bacteroidetes bacterium]|nr:outer membrane lipoprotein carrier protein LolA [Candidatus Limimorpha avicola]